MAYPKYLFIAVLVALGITGINPHDYFTWFLEVLPILIGIPILIATYSRFQFSDLVYTFMAIHALILMVGGHYTYAEVPLGYWLKELFHLTRNPYDRIGHFAQGFIPALISREILLRQSPLKPGKWIFFLTITCCMTVSVFYEFLEWAVAMATGEAADSFLGTQGDIWDTQWDMFMAFVGATVSLLLLSRIHTNLMVRAGTID